MDNDNTHPPETQSLWTCLSPGPSHIPTLHCNGPSIARPLRAPNDPHPVLPLPLPRTPVYAHLQCRLSYCCAWLQLLHFLITNNKCTYVPPLPPAGHRPSWEAPLLAVVVLASLALSALLLAALVIQQRHLILLEAMLPKKVRGSW